MRMHRLVVFIPGIGGSVLRDDDSGETVWSHNKRALLSALRDPGSLDRSRELTPAGLLMDVQALPGWTVAQGYTSMWEGLSGIPGAIPDDATAGVRIERANLIAFPYDFRQSIRDNASALDARVRGQLARLDRADEPDSVIVIAHSMGGLVARHWIACQGGHEVCHALLTLGTPHRGAPKALDVFANDLRIQTPLGGKAVQRLSAQLRAWPSFAELLPRYPCIEDPEHPGTGLYVHDLARLDPQWERLAQAGRHGWELHEEIQAGWTALAKPPKFRVRSGIVQPTLQSARLTARGLEVSELAPLWCGLGIFTQDEGDGTVPAISAFPIDVEDQHTYDEVVDILPVTHGRIGNDEYAVRFVERCEGFPTMTAARGTKRNPGLGIDVPELFTVGTAATVRVSIGGVALDNPAAQRVYVSAAPADDTTAEGDPDAGVENLRADWDREHSQYVVDLPPLSAGYWTISASARAVRRAGTLSMDRDVAVVDLEED